uniref:Cytochrome c oxidase subunit 2 n=1 Tax=Amoebidium parasiticum TaxID=4881 RepID=Q8M0B7_AMOPA|nr:cytochrome c oxidase subunit 2 [Amoebidium parasiticum]
MLTILNKIVALWDVAQPYQINFQDAGSSLAEEIIFFHDKLFFYQIIVLTVVLWMLANIIIKYHRTTLMYKYATHGTWLEIVWTITPALILIIIAFPSFKLLYLMDEVIDPAITIKAVGHQWYWSYEYSDYVVDKDTNASLAFDSYMVPTDDLELGDFRLLEVDNQVVLPIHTHIRVIVTAADVIHSWAVPALGVKIDGIPGRLNGTSFLIKREGLYYGQCSEICGAQHGFMPIAVRAVNLTDYISWVEAQLAE